MYPHIPQNPNVSSVSSCSLLKQPWGRPRLWSWTIFFFPSRQWTLSVYNHVCWRIHSRVYQLKHGTVGEVNIAMENGPFIDDFPSKTSIYKGFSIAMLNNHRVQGGTVVCVCVFSSPWSDLSCLAAARSFSPSAIPSQGQSTWVCFKFGDPSRLVFYQGNSQWMDVCTVDRQICHTQTHDLP